MNPTPDWNKGLVPAIIQEATTGQVLMLGYMNEESYQQTLASGRVTFFSRSRNKIWVKGETSGNYLEFVSVSLDCDRDTLLIQAKPAGPVCHNGTPTCFADDLYTNDIGFLNELSQVIASRFTTPTSEKSYVAKLIADGPDRIAQKVGEEAVETVIAAKNNDLNKFESEAADLLFHLMVLLRSKGSSLASVSQVLKARHK